MTAEADAAQQAPDFISVAALVDELVRSGVTHFSVCPGSRSTPLALTIARHPLARLWMHLDERSASFFALGLAKTLREPVAVVCSSGTAAANFLPAVVEAYYSRIPLIVLTADRPHELRDCGAPQTIDQNRLYGSHAKWFLDLPEPDATPEMLRYVRTVTCQAVATARSGPAGPVHINCPYREPLLPAKNIDLDSFEARPDRTAFVTRSPGPRVLNSSQVASLAGELSAAPHGLIVCGPQDDPHLAEAVVRLAEALGYPVLADPLSGVRCSGVKSDMVLDAYDAFLRDAAFVERFAPQTVLRFGAMPTSKPVQLFLECHADCRQIVVDGDGGWNEPTRLASDMVHADGALLAGALADWFEDSSLSAGSKSARDGWASAWSTADRLARRTMQSRLDGMDELFEGKVFADLAELLPENTVLFTGNSMPIRDLDTFLPAGDRPLRLLSNRGANGIDGVVSSAFGASAAGAGPTVLAIGDVSFYHDSNGLLAAKQHLLDLTIVLLNNNGGGIFSFLPQASDPEDFETLFGTPHGLDFRPLAAMYGATYTLVDGWETFRKAMQRGLGEGGLHIVEVPTERNRNVALHREMWAAVSGVLAIEFASAATV